MVACKPVTFEMYQNTPGVQYVKDGEQNWTPVVLRRERRRSMNSKERTSSGPKNDSSDELDIGAARQVYYQERGKVPGLYVCRGCTRSSVSWIPITASPVSSRTRARIRARIKH